MKRIIMAIAVLLLVCGCSTMERTEMAETYAYPSSGNGGCLVFYLIPDPVYDERITVSKIGDMYIVKSTIE